MVTKTLESPKSNFDMSGNLVARAVDRPTLGSPRRKAASKAAQELAPNEIMLALQTELDAVRREHTKLQQAVYEAAQIQRRLCAPREMAWGGFEIAGESFPVRHLSGDFFKVMELDGTLGLALGDIAGKGLSAGIWQTHLLDLMQRSARTHQHPADAVAEVNRELCRDAGEPPITALFFARINPDKNELVYCNAGLPAPLLMRGDESVERLDEGGPMLGALEEATYASGKVRLDSGDALLAFSDGLTESRNMQDEEFESSRLSAAAKTFLGASASQILFSTLAAVLDFADGCPPSDDLTLLVVRRCDKGAMDQDLRSGQRPATQRPRARQVSGGKRFSANN